MCMYKKIFNILCYPEKITHILFYNVISKLNKI